MARLIPAVFRDLVTRLHREPSVQDALFELPRKNWFIPDPAGPDLGVRFHGRRAGNPSGPAAGPHTQMAQNILLSYLAGGRIIELKTVQEDDRLTIPRPCIDIPNVGYNIEWSQELSIDESLREYVAGAMLIEMFRRDPELGRKTHKGPAGDALFDISVGYDLAGIRRDKVRGFLDGMCAAHTLVERLRAAIPREFAEARDYDYPTRISDSVTLSTFHGCPPEEIEDICEFLIAEYDFNVTVKMNPSMLGRERLEYLLHDVLGYEELEVDPAAWEGGLSLDEGVALCERLTRFAARVDRSVGVKFTNTLPVRNHREVFDPQTEVMYLSGQPLHVIALDLAATFSRRIGPELQISFSAGIDRQNFALGVACGFMPVSLCTDLLRPGGYGRLARCLDELVTEMKGLQVNTINEYACRRFGQGDIALRRARKLLGEQVSEEDLRRATAAWAGLLNTSIVADMARKDPRYRAARNRREPKGVDAQLETFDCLACNKCVPVCPNAANFEYPTPVVAFEYHDVAVTPDGSFHDEADEQRFEIAKPRQFACYADFCNECGNCETFCPEHGGPQLDKPKFFGSVESWAEAAPRDGFVIKELPEGGWIRGRIAGRVYQLTYLNQAQQYNFDDGVAEAILPSWGHQIVSLRLLKPLAADHRMDLGVYHLLRYLREGVLDASRVNQINVAGLNRPTTASG